jgi:hypothetical protein
VLIPCVFDVFLFVFANEDGIEDINCKERHFFLSLSLNAQRFPRSLNRKEEKLYNWEMQEAGTRGEVLEGVCRKKGIGAVFV